MLNTTNNNQPIKILQLELLSWFENAKRNLPFRQTKDPYSIWISEIMAQQTQIDTLIPYYNHFISLFPNVAALAEASEDEVIKAWEGLGYYSRARNLHQAAKLIVSEYDGIFPKQFAQLIKLPGIGPYTGGAIASIAFNEKVSAVDGNVLRVISRYCNSIDDIGEAKTKKKVTQWVETILPDAAGDFNEALMDLGAVICSPQSPKCLICPIRLGCQSFAFGTTDQIPIKKKKQKQLTKKMEVGIVKQNGALFFVRRPESGLLSGMWSFPIIEVSEGTGTDIKKKLRSYFPELSNPVLIGQSRHVFSHIIWEMSVYGFDLGNLVCETAAIPYHPNPSESSESQTHSTQFKALSDIDDLTLPIAFSKLLVLLTDF
ncbi:A/G-specific adenine glycosylase [Acetobacterium tundrae]|uniref:Adenine DNA glycosylase n=1 Tax=Acetobacterium tundrae TaxID=132932 RepID=A0ABR6WL45_9FIRM|nr:A/G-specific adenine glycosylase [Acetobacterium tundrae]MBC3796857.1 A/G-specific adenine glycosylase [Acetobacterium tundrae]